MRHGRTSVWDADYGIHYLPIVSVPKSRESFLRLAGSVLGRKERSRWCS
jgi:hypothetical protein